MGTKVPVLYSNKTCSFFFHFAGFPYFSSSLRKKQ